MDYRTAFELAPVGMVISAKRLITDCNAQLLAIFGASRDQLLGQSFEILYPSPAEFERTGARIVAALDKRGFYADERVMRRMSGELFWCQVSGRTLKPGDPHAEGIWSFDDLSALRPVKADLTAREREIAALLIEGLTSKLIGKRLDISPRTVDIYRGRLIKKYGASGTPDLIHKLLVA